MAALKAVIAKIDEVPEGLRDFYVKKGEGKDEKFHLQVDGMRTQADIENLQRGNAQERAAHTKTKTDLKTATDKLAAWGELDPETVTTQLEELERLKAAGPNPDANKIREMVDTQVAQRLLVQEKKWAKEKAEIENNLTLTSKERDTLRTSLDQRTIDEAVRDAATAAKLNTVAVPDALMHARSAFKLVDGKVLTEDGQTPADWIEARKDIAPHWWPVATGTGAGAGGSGGGAVNDLSLVGGKNPFSFENWNLTKAGAIIQSKPEVAARLAEAAGVPKKADGTFNWGQKPPAPAKAA